MKKSVAYNLISLLFVVGCVHEQAEFETKSSYTTSLTARMESQMDTKTILGGQTDGMYFPLWSGRDSLAVFTSPGQRPTLFTMTSGEGETMALFEGPLAGDRYVALFPYNSEVRWIDNNLCFNLPQKQVHRPNSFALDGFPMIAQSETGDLSFKNLCSIIHLSITGNAVIGSITLHSDSHFLSGPAHVNLSYGDSPMLVMEDGGSHDVRLDCSAVQLTPNRAKDFYIVVPPATYEGLSIIIDAYTDKVTKTISHDVKMVRSELRSVTPFMIEAPMIDLDNIPDNQLWYKTKSGRACSFEGNENPPFDIRVISNTYDGDYGVIVFEEPLRKLNNYAFLGMSDIIELHLPDTVEELGMSSLPELSSFRIPGNLKKIGQMALHGIDSIYGPLVAEDGYSVVNEGVLLGVIDKDIDDYVTPPGVETVGEYSLMGVRFNSISFSDGVIKIEEYALMYAHVNRITISESVVEIGRQVVIEGVKGFYGSSRCTSEDHMCLINPKGYYGPELVALAVDQPLEVFSIPEGIVTIACSFFDWPNLRIVGIPESLSWFAHLGLIGGLPSFEGFEGPNITSDGRCLIKNGVVMGVYGEGIKDYTIPSGANMIQMSCLFAFNHEGEIENLTISEGVEVLNQYCLEESSTLKTVTLPTTIKTISYNVFSGDDHLESVYLPVRIPPLVLGAPGNGVAPNLKVYVPEESYDAYMADPSWRGLWGHYLTPYHFDKIDPPAPYESVDYSLDGKVTVLQKASEGNGIDIVLMGDAFSDRMIEDGRYLAAMKKMENAFFGIEPYRSFRHLFNVYMVNVVSPSEDYLSENLAFDTEVYPDGSVGADLYKCLDYASYAIPDDRLDEVTILLVDNTFGMDPGKTSGTCYTMTRGDYASDYGSGVGLALFSYPWGQNIVQHEAGGHGFAKLGDEYTSRSEGIELTIPDDEIKRIKELQKKGWRKNVDFTSDPSQVLWKHFLSDSRYDREHLGVFEGAGMFYSRGIYRPSEEGLMNSGAGGFNAPSREAIYYRIHKLAYGPEWQYDYEEFVRWDQGLDNIHPTSVDTKSVRSGDKKYEVRDPLPVTKSNPDEWTVTVMK